ncbi:MAG: spermidine/putrescine ABC transporter substrate-binding protein [Oscillospiraceae bacterium]|nr:spermidine/putrescine ABC transporter substrate-binding protein [Oscillospiraceae bacterium]
MKKLLSVLIICALCVSVALPLASCGDDANTIVVYNWGQYMSTGADVDAADDVIKLFTQETGIKVKYRNFATNEELYAKLKSGGAKCDVIVPSDYMIEKMVKENMLAKIDYSNIPNYSNIMDDFKNLEYDPDNEYTVPYFWGTVGIIYNKKYITEPVDSWDILWSDKYQGKILMFNNPRDAFAIALNKLGYSMNSTNPDEIRAAAAELKKQNFIYKMDEFFEMLPSENAYMMPYYAGDYITVHAENEDLAFAIPKSGTNIFNDAFCIPVTSGKKELAEKFINFMLKAEIGKLNTEYVGYSTPNKAVYDLLGDDVKNDGISYPDISDKWEHYRYLPDDIDNLMRDLWIEVKSSNQ